MSKINWECVAKTIIVISLLVIITALTTGCVKGERMVRIVETGVQTDGLLYGGAIGGVRVETSNEPLRGNLQIYYHGNKGQIRYDSRGAEQ